MSPPKPTQILKLYKDLLRYGQQLKYTDKNYYYQRIQQEFKNCKYLSDQTEIKFNFKRVDAFRKQGNKVVKRMFCRIRNISAIGKFRLKHTLDFSKVPKILEADLDEQFVRGSGPGGQSVNKTANCVVLLHKPTGVVVKCHESRSLSENRRKAREKLVTKVDNYLNKEHSIEAQRKVIDDRKNEEVKKRKAKIREMKRAWKERENLN